MAWALIEKLRMKKPTTARELAGFPIEYEYKEVSVGEKAVRDETIMADGRPAYAWWNEIQMLRGKEPSLQKQQALLIEQMVTLKIAEWVVYQDVLSDDLFIRFKRDRLIMADDPRLEVLKDPGKYCEMLK